MYKAEHHDFHPLLAELEGMTTELIRLQADAERLASLAANAQREVDPAAWTKRIESVLEPEDNERLEQLRLHRRETVLWHTSVLSAYHVTCTRIYRLRDAMGETIKKLAQIGAGLTHKSEEHWLKPILLNNCIWAEQLRSKVPAEDKGLPTLGDLLHRDLHYSTLTTAFEELLLRLKHFPKCKTGHLFVGHSFTNLYPSEPIVHPAHIGQSWPHEEVRKVVRVHFINATDRELPSCQRLSDLLPVLEAADDKALAAMKALLRGEKGRVNEKQYSARLVHVLDRNTPTYAVKSEKAQQHANRIDYESARVVLYAEILAAEEVRRQVVSALHDAIAETQALQQALTADRINTSESKEVLRLALINCLAADVMVRESGRLHKELHEVYREDITNGQGSAALQQEFDTMFGKGA